MARRRVWQGVLEWLRPGDAAESRVARHAGDAPIRGVSRAPRSAQTGRAPARANGRAALWQGTGDRGGLDSEPFGGPFGYGAGAEDGWADGDAAVAELASEAELLEFLASDLDPVPVDPVFRERLREELWSIVQADGLKRSGDH